MASSRLPRNPQKLHPPLGKMEVSCQLTGEYSYKHRTNTRDPPKKWALMAKNTNKIGPLGIYNYLELVFAQELGAITSHKPI